VKDTAEMEVTGAITDLEQRAARYPPEHYPIQHATAQFHLGGLLAGAGRLHEAAAALAIASRLFDPERLPVEHAKALNALGVVHRLAGDVQRADAAFGRAAALFSDAELPLERGAVLYNRGLVCRDRKDDAAAVEYFTQARGLLDPETEPAEAAAAARELGSSLLTTGQQDMAIEVLESALRLATSAGDHASRGATANLLGLCHLAADRPADAIAAFQEAVASHPRSIRPGEYAMAKANLALGYEQLAAKDHAWLAAAQALGTPGSPEPVRVQADELLARLGPREGALLAVLDIEPEWRWPALVREDLARWVDADTVERRAVVGAWVDGQVERRASAVELAEVWLGGLLELPPESMIVVVRATLEALALRDPGTSESFRAVVARAVVRFHVPQWMRLTETFNTVATELGQEASWA
jgi:tetratricopeptide (TPR) repeat protein